jgi:hypothetical protein
VVAAGLARADSAAPADRVWLFAVLFLIWWFWSVAQKTCTSPLSSILKAL